MKAIICPEYGPPEVLEMVELAKPKPLDDEILIKIKATAVNSSDIRVRGLKVSGILRLIMRIVLGFKKPRKQVLGQVFSGIVEETGKRTIQFKPLDEVYGMTGLKFSCNAEYVCVKENSAVLLKPSKASFEEAAAIIFGGCTAIYFLRKGKINEKPNSEVLICGATGSVGSSAIQIAKFYKARVTAVCSYKGIELSKSLGADTIVDYTKEDITQITKKFDIIFDCVGKMNKEKHKHLLSQNGKYITVGGLDTAKESKEQLLFLKKLYDKQILKHVIDKTYPLDEIIEAHQYVELGVKKGNVIITI